MLATLSDREWRFFEYLLFFALYTGGAVVLYQLFRSSKPVSSQTTKLWLKVILLFTGGALILNLLVGLLFTLNLVDSGALLLALTITMIVLATVSAKQLSRRLRDIHSSTEDPTVL